MIACLWGRVSFLICLVLVPAVLETACEKVPLLAPTGSTITLTAAANVLPSNGTLDITAVVIESSGFPPHSGTQISFTTTVGRVDPAQTTTDASGRAIVKFIAGGSNGTATIVASSGGASTGTTGALKIAVGTAAVGRVTVNASPATIPALGGSTTITANVVDINGSSLPSVPVTFTTTAGTLSVSVVTTSPSGQASTSLTTSLTATVTATVGAQGSTPGGGTTGGGTSGGGTTGGGTSSGQASASVTVNIAAAPTLVITPPTTPPSAGLPAVFTFAVTPAAQNGSAVRDVTVNWGDGQTQDLGAVTGNAVVSHVYVMAATYTITATVTDAAGNTSTVSTAINVIIAPRPTIIISYSPIPAKVNTETRITIQVTAATGIGITSTSIDFGDGTPPDMLGGATGASVPHVYTIQKTYTVTVTVIDTLGQTTIGTTSVSVGQ